MGLFATHDLVDIDDYGIHDERYTFAKGAGQDALTALILEHYRAIRDRFGGPLEAVRARAAEDNIDLTEDDILHTAMECYAGYLTDDPCGQAAYDQDVCGIMDSTLDYLEEFGEEAVREMHPEMVGHDGEIMVGALDREFRADDIRSMTYPLTDPVSGKEYYFTH